MQAGDTHTIRPVPVVVRTRSQQVATLAIVALRHTSDGLGSNAWLGLWRVRHRASHVEEA